MKISKKDFQQMKKKYAKEVKKGRPAKTRRFRIADQTDWIYFDRETLERILSKSDPDPKKGGIIFHFTEYTEEVAMKNHPENPEDYEGLLTLVLEPASPPTEGKLAKSSMESYENRGYQCPPRCPDPKKPKT